MWACGVGFCKTEGQEIKKLKLGQKLVGIQGDKVFLKKQKAGVIVNTCFCSCSFAVTGFTFLIRKAIKRILHFLHYCFKQPFHGFLHLLLLNSGIVDNQSVLLTVQLL